MKFIRRGRRRRQEPAGRRPAAHGGEQVPAGSTSSNPDELLGGFPKTREELFAYRAIILGSVEAASFTPEQLRMLADFVSKRGGGLLMLGGRRSFAEGGWGGTPVGEVLPVVIDAADCEVLLLSSTCIRRAPAALFPVTQIADTEQASTAKWNDMPQVSTVNSVHQVKPGATVLLTGVDSKRQDQVVLAYQRYGRGKAIAMPIQDSWLWQMDAKMPVTDTTHAMFWRRMVRWLVDGVPDQVNVTTTADRVEPGEPIKLSAEVLDAAYVEVNDSRVVAQRHVAVREDERRAGRVDGHARRRLPGELRARRSRHLRDQGHRDARRDGADPEAPTARDQKDLGTASMHVRVSAGDAEYFDAAMRAPLLKRIAEETGGRFFTPANGVVAARSDQLQRPRRHRRRRARAVGHAGAAASPLIGLVGARVGLPPRCGGWREIATAGIEREGWQHAGDVARAVKSVCGYTEPRTWNPRRGVASVRVGVGPRRY